MEIKWSVKKVNNSGYDFCFEIEKTKITCMLRSEGLFTYFFDQLTSEKTSKAQREKNIFGIYRKADLKLFNHLQKEIVFYIEDEEEYRFLMLQCIRIVNGIWDKGIENINGMGNYFFLEQEREIINKIKGKCN